MHIKDTYFEKNYATLDPENICKLNAKAMDALVLVFSAKNF